MGRGFGVFHLIVALAAALVIAVPVLAIEESQAQKWFSAVEKKPQADDTTQSSGLDTSSKSVRTIVVDQSGKGNYKNVQDAIDSVPNGNKKRVVIVIRAGVYRQKVLIPQEKPYITFQCAPKKTTLVWGDTGASAGGTSNSASVAVESTHFITTDCTFANSAPAPAGGEVGKQAVALRISGDLGAFYGCSFYGAHDTLYDQAGRHYFKDCFIQGSIDYIFGDGQSIYQSCQLNSIAQGTSGSVTAQDRSAAGELTGFSFVGCSLTGSGTIYLGRAWGTYSRVVFIRCSITEKIIPAGWFDWDDATRQKTVFYGEYECTGVGANRAERVKWSRVLTAKQAAAFSSLNFIDGQMWLGISESR